MAIDFDAEVLPIVARAWDCHCLCKSPGFVKLMSFDFRPHGTSPAALYDAERIGSEIILKRFREVTPWEDTRLGSRQTRECSSCGTRCTLTYEQFSINFDCTAYDFGRDAARADIALYLVGFYGYRDRFDFPGYRHTASVAEFLASIGVT